MAFDDYHDAYDLYDMQYEMDFYDPTSTPEYEKRIKQIMKNSTKKYERNKFYVGSDSVFNGRDWGHPTLNAAVKHGEELLTDNDKDEVFIVKIVRVIRRKKAPVEVIEIK